MNTALLKLGKTVKNLVLLNTGTIKDCGCEEFAKMFSDRYFYFDLAEASMLSAACGFAIAGKIPVVLGNAQFLLSRAFDQVYNDICVPNLNVKIVGFGSDYVAQELVKILPNMAFKKGEKQDLKTVIYEYGPAYLEIE